MIWYDKYDMEAIVTKRSLIEDIVYNSPAPPPSAPLFADNFIQWVYFNSSPLKNI